MLSVRILTPLALLSLLLALLYRLFAHDPKNLRKYPSPSFAGFTSLWRFTQHLKYRQSQAVCEAHQRLGTFIRITPAHLSISSPEAIQPIYGHGSKFLKDAWYDGGAGPHRNLADCRDRAMHQGKRRKMAHVFAPKSIQGLEGDVLSHLNLLMRQMSEAAAKQRVINMRLFINYFTIDAIMSCLLSEQTGCLERLDDIVTAETLDGRTYKSEWIEPLNAGQQVAVPLGYEPHLMPVLRPLIQWLPVVKTSKKFDDIVHHYVHKRMSRGFEETSADFLAQIVYKSDKRGEDAEMRMDMGEILAEFGALMNAGSDTASASIVHLIYFLYLKKHTHVLERLREELDPVFEAAGECMPSYETLNRLPYLKACVDESLRLAPASPSGLPRVVPAGGCTIAGEFIEEGTTVSIPTFTLLRNAEAFENADDFDPDRWLRYAPDSERMAFMKQCHLPFSTGTRACIGRNLSNFELVLAGALTAYLFDIDFTDPKLEKTFRVWERANLNPVDIFAVPRVRKTAAWLA